MTVNTDKVRTLLMERHRELREQGEAQSSKNDVTLDQQVLGHISRMDAMHQRALVEAAARQRQFEIISIETALRRIEEEEYGYCDRCGNEISEKRLEVNPSATFCITCAD